MSGADFFGRDAELRQLDGLVRERNHVLLTGQRRMGKTSIVRERLFSECARHNRPVFLALDELPIFLKRMLREDGNAQRVDEFLSWLRKVLQSMGERAPVLLVSGSIGLEPLVRKLGLPDRINHLYRVRLPPWDRDNSVACLERLAASHGLSLEDGVAEAVYESLGVGVPHHVQAFFARLRDFATMGGRRSVSVSDVHTVYRSELLGPPGQSDLVHYETRLKEALDDETFGLAMEILAEAATQGVFTPSASTRLGDLYSNLVDNAGARIAEALDVLVHDGYLDATPEGHRLRLNLLRDWWVARFRDHHMPIEQRAGDVSSAQSTS